MLVGKQADKERRGENDEQESAGMCKAWPSERQQKGTLYVCEPAALYVGCISKCMRDSVRSAQSALHLL